MGVYLSKPNTVKKSEYGENSNFKYGLTSMQGWRQTMEDAHCSILNLDIDEKSSIGLYGVFDGHGGSSVSNWISKHLADVLKQEFNGIKENKDKLIIKKEYSLNINRLATTLKETFIRLDEIMQEPESLEEIKMIHQELTNLRNSEVESVDSQKKFLAQQPQALFKAFFDANNAGCKPMIKVVEENGERFLTITNEKTENSELDEQLQDEEKIVGADEIFEKPEKIEPIELDKAVSFDISKFSEVEGKADNEFKLPNMNVNTGIPETCGAAVVVAGFIKDENGKPFVVVANAGDSRAVICRDGKAISLSNDHKPTQREEVQRIYNAGGFVENGRIDGNLNLSRTLGDLMYKRNTSLPVSDQKITAVPGINILALSPKDEFVIIACDGIWDCLSNQEAIDFIRERLPENPDSKQISQLCEEMCDKCLASNPMESDSGIGCDNMTIIIIVLNKNYTNEGAVKSELFEVL